MLEHLVTRGRRDLAKLSRVAVRIADRSSRVLVELEARGRERWAARSTSPAATPLVARP